MSLVLQKIAHFLNGVSQRPVTQRLSTQAVEQVNGLSSLSRGVMKRPPTQHVSQLTDDTEGWDDAFIHIVNRNESERYHVVVVDGAVQVFDMVSGAAVPVETPDGTDYLVDSLSAGFRAVTVGDTTIIVNRGTVPRKGADQAPAAVNEALIYVRQVDFSTAYTVTLDTNSIGIRTLDMTDPVARRGISTDQVAAALVAELTGSTPIAAAFTVTLIGSTIHIIRKDAADFTASVSDGLSDNGLKLVKDKIQAFEDLPARAKNGFVVQVTGSIDTAKDDYFVKYDDLGVAGGIGVWRECPRPGTLIALDPTTMPHALTLRGEIPLAESAHQVPVVGGVLSGFQDASFDGYAAYDSLTNATTFSGGLTYYQTQEYGGGGQWTADADVDSLQVDVSLSVLNNLWVSGEKAQIITLKNGVIVQKLEYDLGLQAPPSLTLSINGVANLDVLQIRLAYASGADPAAGIRAVMQFSRFKKFSNADTVVTVVDPVGMPNGRSLPVYPPSTSISLLLADGITIPVPHFDVTTGAADTPDDVAAALAALVDASADYTASYTSGNTFSFHRTDGTPISVGYTFAYGENIFVNPSLNLGAELMVDDPWVGKILENVTDGSKGTIVHHGDTWIEVDDLVGGVRNQFDSGDIARVTVDPDAGTHFVFAPIQWNPRVAGDLDVVGFPSFVNSQLSDVFFFQNRLGFLCKENIIFSSAGDLFNFFRYTATDLRPDDMIDIRSAHADVTIFDSAFLWAGGLFVKSDNVWFTVTGEPAITPTTIRLDPVGRYPSSKDPKPAVVGDTAFFTRAKNGNTQVFQIQRGTDPVTSQEITEDTEVSKDLPAYLTGSPKWLVGDSAESFLALLTDGEAGQTLYIFCWLDNGGTRQLSSWSRWRFAPGTKLLAMDMSDGVLGLVRMQSDGIYFEQLDLSLTQFENEKVEYLDRRFEPGVHAVVFGAGVNTWELPYAVATDGSEGLLSVVDVVSGVVYPVTRPDATHVAVTHTTLDGRRVWIGQPYQFLYQPSTLFLRNKSDQPETAGRLQIRFLELFYRETTDFTITVTPLGRPPIAYTVNDGALAAGSLKIPILCRNLDAQLVITNDTPGACALTELDWEGWLTTRGQRM